MCDKKDFYIYNLEQARFFIFNGAKVLDVGKGNKNDIYIKFARNNENEHIFELWCNRK